MKKVINFLFVNTKAGFFLLAALLWSAVMYFVNSHYKITWKEIFVEADGMVFDLIVFGIVLTIYEAYREIKEKKERALREKNERIERLQEEIDDYREWDEKEATYRICGAIRRLNQNGVSKINLRRCYLHNAKLGSVDLCDSNLKEANLILAFLQAINLKGANLTNAKLENANLIGANLQNSILVLANLKKADMGGAFLLNADLRGANLRGVYLGDANLLGTKLSQASVDPDWFEKIREWEIIGLEQIEKSYLIDVKGQLRLRSIS